MAGLPYRLYGGATRPDAISGLDPTFSQALAALHQAAPPEVQAELGLNSAYRSAAIQQGLWDRSDKTGHSVARPGRSKHQAGTAADLWGFGLGGGAKVSPATRDWVTQNAAAHGLYFPMGHEPWHIQLRGDGSPSGGVADVMADATVPAAASVPGFSFDLPAGGRVDRSPQLVAGNEETAPAALEYQPVGPAMQPPQAAPETPLSPLAALFQVRPVGGALQQPRRS